MSSRLTFIMAEVLGSDVLQNVNVVQSEERRLRENQMHSFHLRPP